MTVRSGDLFAWVAYSEPISHKSFILVKVLDIMTMEIVNLSHHTKYTSYRIGQYLSYHIPHLISAKMLIPVLEPNDILRDLL